MIERYDAIVVGAGISGDVCAHRLRLGGMRVALVEREQIGGECAYWASIPTAMLLGPANAHFRAQTLSGMASPAIASPRSLTPADVLLSSLDEMTQIEGIEKEGGVFIRGEARFSGHGQVEVEGRHLQAPHIVIAAGSEPAIPPIPGLSEAGFWTNREATTALSIPQSVVILGGEGQAVELGQMFRLYGAEVTLISRHTHLLDDEDPEIGTLLAHRLRGQGIRVALGSTVTRVDIDKDHAHVVTLADRTEIHAQALVVAAQRQPRLRGLNIDAAGVQRGPQGIVIDETCRAAEGVWAIGAVTSVGQLSHTAQYQARIAADDILGRPHAAHYDSTPRVYYTDPQIAITGQTNTPAPEAGHTAIVSISLDFKEKQTHATSARQPENGRLTFFADATQGTLVGAWAAATEASEWIQLAVLAIRAHVPLLELRDTLEQFPPFGETLLAAVDQLVAGIAQPVGSAHH